jgi:Astacin (Peptidase family M12A)
MTMPELIKCCIDRPIGADMPSYAALVTAKKWPNGQLLRVRFLDGLPEVQSRVTDHAQLWGQYANIKFAFGNDPDAEIRISFRYQGSWSTIGTDSLTVAATEASMNYGWLTTDTADDEYNRVVLHEFGHALGLIHEHQNPAGGIPWNKAKVYASLSGPPNNWDKATIDHNMFETYAKNQTNYTAVDRDSIMMYPIPAEFTDGKFVVGWNRDLSQTDRDFIARMYPKPAR